MKYLLSAAILLTLVSNGWSAKLIVAPSGADYTSIQQGVNDADAGDTVLVKAGLYYEMVSFSKSGSENNYMTLLGEPGAIIDGQKEGVVGITISNMNYIKVTGMEVQNFRGRRVPIGISVRGSCSNIELRNNKVHHIENANGNAHGIAIYGNGNVYYGQSASSSGSWNDEHAKYVDPLLVNPYTNMHLKAGSPAIDAGFEIGTDESDSLLSGTEDIDNQSRKENDAMDIGADEYKKSL